MKYKTLIATAVLLASGIFSLGLAHPTLAAVKCPPGSTRNPDGTTEIEVDDINSSAQCYLPKPETDDKGKTKDVIWYIRAVIDVILGLVGVIAVVVIIIGGISFITSQGDPGKVTKARNAILYGVVGLVIALLSFSIVNFVLKNMSGSSDAESSEESTED